MARRRGTCRRRAGSAGGRSAAHRRRLRFEPLEDRRVLAVMTVTDLQDGTLENLAGDGQVSLREAIEAINTGAAVDGIGPTSGTFGVDDEIIFDASLFTGGGQTILLVAGELGLTRAVTISGPGQDLLTIDAQQNSRIFDINGPGNNFDVTIAGLTLTRGQMTGNNPTFSVHTFNGGAIRSLSTGNLAIEHTAITNSHVAGDRTNGGGIFTLGDVTLTDSSVSGNSAGSFGGGIYARFSDATLTRSTVSGNFAGSGGGGIFSSSDVTLSQSTVSGNSAFQGGGIRAQGDVTLTQSTVSGNTSSGSGGGIYSFFNSGSVTLSGSIVAGNTAGSSGPDLSTGDATVQYSLIGDDSGATITDTGGNQIGTSGAPIDPLMGPLADNGGPTKTHALLFGSPAIDAGDPNIAFNPNEFDQRGAPFVRVFDGDGVGGARIDMGAYERQTVPDLNLVVDTATDETDGDYAAGDLSLREAIGLANGRIGADTITFAAALSGQTIMLGRTELQITEALTIDATSLTAPLTIDAQQQSRIFDINGPPNDFDVTIAGMTLTRGQVAGNGGAIRSLSTGDLALQHTTVTDSRVTGSSSRGGGIFTVGDVTLSDSTVSRNSAIHHGGGIFAADVTLTQSTVSGNSAAGAFGGVYSSGSVTLIQSTVSGNFTGGSGGGIGAIRATLTQSSVSGNIAGFRGGGIRTNDDVTLTQSTVSGNFAGVEGGGIFAAEVTLSGSIVAGNSASFFGPDLRGIGIATYSLIGNDSGATITDNGGNQIGTSGAPINPLLGPLADHGGPTQTHALLAGSPAVDAGDPAAMAGVGDVPLYDQRGEPFTRVVNGRIDIGAYEAEFIVPASLVVDTLDDNLNGDISSGNFSLREALWLANLDADHQTIAFAPSLSGATVMLDPTLDELAITRQVTIEATSLAGGITIDAGNGADGVPATGDGFRIFNIERGAAARINVELSGLTLTGGDLSGGGGAIRSAQENLTIRASTISGNHSTFEGGAINAGGILTIENSTLSGNSGSEGGAVRSVGTLFVLNSTISGNEATIGRGGGIHAINNATIRNSTITDNSAATNGGGVAGSLGSITIQNSIVAGNTSGGNNPDLLPGAGALTVDYSLIGDTAGLSQSHLNTINAGTGNLLGINPLLGLLADNGGPMQTHALLPGSPAIDAGNPSFVPPPGFDQRGAPFSRATDIKGGGNRVDIGAYEVQAAPAVLVVDTDKDELDADFSPGNLSLRESLGWAQTLPGPHTITFAASVGGGTLLLDLGQMQITEALTIDATSVAGGFTIDAQHNSRIFDIDGPGANFAVTIAGLTLTRGRMMGDDEIVLFNGGAIRSLSMGDLIIEHSTITDSHVIGNLASGGGIFTLGDVTLTDSTVSGNSAGLIGGGMSVRFGDATLTRSTVSGNYAGGGSGGIRANGNVTLTQSTVSGNSAGGPGGGIEAISNVTLTRSTVSGNFAGAGGGGIRAIGNVTLTHSTVSGNSTGGSGGGILSLAGNATLSGSIVAGNTADISGPDLSTVDATAEYSLIGDGSDATTNNIGGTSQIGTIGAPIDPLMGPLADNGGPTKTHALLFGSPAIDAADPSIALNPNEFDQRGAPFVRVFDGDGVGGPRIDMGAYERQSLAPAFFVVTTAFDEWDYTNGDVSLREAINSSNGSAGAQTITFVTALSGQTILLALGQMQITEALTIDATSLAGGFTVDAQHNSRIFDIDGPGTNFDVTIAGLTLTRGQTTGDNLNVSDHTFSGGAIRSLSTGDLTIEHSTITDSHVIGNLSSGGGMFTLGDVTLIQSTVSGNSAESDGGGIVATGDMTLTQSTVSGNSTGGSGGGIDAFQNLTLSGAIVAGNSAGFSGPDVRKSGDGATAEYSLIGDRSGASMTNVDGTSQIGTGGAPIDPLLGPLADNGGPTLTHALLPGSPAIDAGDPNFTSPPQFDQRGAPYYRVTDGDGDFVARIDIGAVESFGLRNPSFEAGGGSLDAWPAFNSTGVSDSIALHGGHSARVTNHPAGFSGIFQGVPIQGGEVLVASVQTWVDAVEPIGAGNFGELKLEFFSAFGGGDLLGQQIVFTADDTTATDVWQQTTLMAMAPAGAVEARVVATFVGSTPGALYYDALSLREALVVDTLVDESDGDFSSGDFSLREAIELANGSGIAETIVFAPSLSGQTILLTQGQMTIEDEVTIDATGLAAPMTIDANLESRIFDIDGPGNNFDVTIVGLTLTRGQMTGDNSSFSDHTFSGGAIRSLTTGVLNIEQSTIADSQVTGSRVLGGGVFTLGDVTLTDSIVSGNSAARTTAFLPSGGGIFANLSVMLTQSTVSGNSSGGNGGGIDARTVTLTQSTVSGNSAGGSGGGIQSRAGNATLSGSIVAGNTAGSFPDLGIDAIFGGGATAEYSLIGDGSGTSINNVDGTSQIGTSSNPIDPLLGPLADNGGPTLTHALLAGSPAIDAGDPDFDPDDFDPPLVNDQRGAGFPRMANGRIDIGAYEAQIVPPALPGDYNANDTVNAADYVLWRKTLGQTGVTPFSGADGNGDGEITEADYGVWRANFGSSLPPLGAGSGAILFAVTGPALGVDELVVPNPDETTSAPVETELDAPTSAGFARLEERFARHDAVFRSLGRREIYSDSDSGRKNPLHLLAMDQVDHSSLEDFPLARDRGNNDRAIDNVDRYSLIDSPLAVSLLPDWRSTRQIPSSSGAMTF